MARIDRGRLDAARFAVTAEIATRFDDLDVQGHVNNAAAVVILQEARVMLNRAAGLGELRGGLRTMVAGLTVEYAGELRYPVPVQVGCGIAAIGRTSFTIAQRASQEGHATLYAEAVMVLADAGGPVALPNALRAAFEALKID